MKRPLAIVLVALTFSAIGLGFVRGWFAVSSPSRDSESNKVNINLTVAPDRLKEDATTVKEKASELTDKVTEEAKELGDKVKDKVKTEGEELEKQ